MATPLSKLTEHHNPLVLDASVAINLLGTGEPASILRALDRQIIIDEYAVQELLLDPYTKTTGEHTIARLARDGLLQRERLNQTAYDIFLELTGAPSPDDLGDGEAATIATAMITGAIPVIDERKARRVYNKRSAGAPVLHTIDLLAARNVTSALDEHVISTMVYNAIHHARMRVPQDCREWVISVLGPDRANACTSINALIRSKT